MSFSHSQSGAVKTVKDDFKATFPGTPLDEPLKTLRTKVEACLSTIQHQLGDNWPVNFSASGDQTMDGNNVTAVSLSVSITPV